LEPIIEIKNLSKTFGSGDTQVAALHNVSLAVKPGEIFGIIGLSGAGKSTLVRCINLLERPDEGQILFHGKNLMVMPDKLLRQQRRTISMIFQSFNLLAQRNALRNVCYPLEIAGVPKKDAMEKAKKLLTIVGLEDRMYSYPAQLSGGQKQRVAIARALATDPEVLLCDEATSALDPNTTRAILDLLQDINKNLGVTIIVITHEMRVVEQICNKVAVLDHGVVAETGLVKDIFVSPQSAIAKELVLPKNAAVPEVRGNTVLRLVFDGESSYEPVISNLSLECHTAVNILGADTKNIGGKAYGQMLLQLPEDEASITRIRAYLDSRNLKYEEVHDNV